MLIMIMLIMLLIMLRIMRKGIVGEGSVVRAREGFDVLKDILQDAGLLHGLGGQGLDGPGGAAKGGLPSREKAFENVGVAIFAVVAFAVAVVAFVAVAFVATAFGIATSSKSGFKGGSSGHAHNCCRHG